MEDNQGMLCKLFHKHGRSPQKAITGCAVRICACKPVIRRKLVRYNLKQEVILIQNILSHKNFNVPSKA